MRSLTMSVDDGSGAATGSLQFVPISYPTVMEGYVCHEHVEQGVASLDIAAGDYLLT